MSAPEAGDRHLPGFSWVIDGELAGMGRPGTPWSPLRDVLQALREQGVDAIVSLTEIALDEEVVDTAGMGYLHAPIPDFGVPDIETIEQVNAFIDQGRDVERGTVIHCAAGLGRTGTILACYLVHIGTRATEAVARIRALRPGSIETREQEVFVSTFEEHRRGAPD